MKLKSALLILLLMASGQAMAQNTGFDWYSKGSKVYFFAKDTTYSTYEWDFGEPLATGTGKTTVHTYAGYNKQYTVVLTVTDSNANKSTYQNMVGTGIYENSTIPDTTAPILKLNGSSTVTVTFKTKYIDPGITIVDDRDSITTWDTSGGFYEFFPDGYTTYLGTFSIVYEVKDKAGNQSTVTRYVKVQDNLPPVITLNGDKFVTMQVLTTFSDPGVTASDNDKILAIEKSGNFLPTLNSNGQATALGNFILKYTAKDRRGNSASVTRYFNVIDTIPPTITLYEFSATCYTEGETIPWIKPAQIGVGDNYWDQANIKVSLEMCHQEKPTKPGTYKILRYKAIDGSNNVSYTHWRHIIIKPAGDESPCELMDTLKNKCYKLGFNAMPELTLIEGVKIYPNPASDNVTVQFDDFRSEHIVIRLRDLSGREVLKEASSSDLQSNRFEINTSQLHSGIYFIEICSERGVLTKKINIAH